jgi:hypothetical protein
MALNLFQMKEEVIKEPAVEKMYPTVGQLVIINKDERFSYGFVKATYIEYFVIGDTENGSDVISYYDNDEDIILTHSLDGEPVTISEELLMIYDIVHKKYIKSNFNISEEDIEEYNNKANTKEPTSIEIEVEDEVQRI